MNQTPEVGAIQSDALMTTDDAANALLKNWEDDAGTEPSEPEGNAEQDAETPAAEAEASEEGESTEKNETDDPQDDKDSDPADEAKVKVTVDGEEREVSVKELKRLYGQEAALTKKSMAVADTQKQLAQAQEYVEATLELALAQAEEAFSPYKDIDWVVASKRLSEEELTALREDATRAYNNYKALTEKTGEYMKQKQEKVQAQTAELIKEAHKELSDPERGIPNWSKETYQELASYAQSLGFPKEAIDTFVTAPVWKLLHKAHQYDKAKTVTTQKVNKTPTKTVKTTKRAPEPAKHARAKDALARMRESGGGRDATVDAFMSRWAD